MEKVEDDEELMECMRGGQAVYVCSSEGFKIAWTEEMHGDKLPLRCQPLALAKIR